MYNTSKDSNNQSVQESTIVDQLMSEPYDDNNQYLSAIDLDKTSNSLLKSTSSMLNSETITEIKELTTDLETQKSTNLPCKLARSVIEQSCQFVEFVASSVSSTKCDDYHRKRTKHFSKTIQQCDHHITFSGEERYQAILA